MQIARDTASLSLQWDRAYVYISIVYVMYRQTNMKKKVARTKWGVLLCVCVLQADLNDLAATSIAATRVNRDPSQLSGHDMQGM